MTIRRQTLLGVVPVFAALALLSTGVAYWLEARAILRGLREESGALAVTIAAFLRAEDLPTGDGAAASGALKAGLERLDRWALVDGFAVWDPVAKKLLYRRPENASLPPPTAEIRTLLAAEPYANTELHLDENNRQRMVAYAAARNEDREIIALVGVGIDASFFGEETSALRQRLAWIAVLVISFGFLVAWLLSAIIRREIRRLTISAATIDQGNYTPPPTRFIQEVAELGHTFGVLGSVIDEVRAKSQRALAENERFRTEEDLLATYRAAFHAPIKGHFAGRAVAVASFGSESDLCFAAAGAAGEHGWVAFGRIDDTVSLDGACRSSAVQQEFSDRLDHGEEPEAVLTAVARLFTVGSATVVSWKRGSADVVRWDLYGSTPESTLLTPVAAQRAFFVHDLPAAFVTATDIYLSRAPKQAPETLVEDLRKLAEDSTGTLAVIAIP